MLLSALVDLVNDILISIHHHCYVGLKFNVQLVLFQFRNQVVVPRVALKWSMNVGKSWFLWSLDLGFYCLKWCRRKGGLARDGYGVVVLIAFECDILRVRHHLNTGIDFFFLDLLFTFFDYFFFFQRIFLPLFVLYNLLL